jgi:hypothetical protein
MQNGLIKKGKKPNTWLKAINILTILINTWFAFLGGMILVSRTRLMEMSEDFFRSNQLMGSKISNILLHPVYIIVPICFFTAMIIKEYKIVNLKNRLYINLVFLVFISAYIGLLANLVFHPIALSKP